MARKCLLFAYGLLQPGVRQPRSLSQSWRDRVKGELWDFGEFPAATAIGKAGGWFDGFTMEIDEDELPALDEFEDVESGEYRRIVVETENGFTAWVYEWAQPLPASAKRITKWQTTE